MFAKNISGVGSEKVGKRYMFCLEVRKRATARSLKESKLEHPHLQSLRTAQTPIQMTNTDTDDRHVIRLPRD